MGEAGKGQIIRKMLFTYFGILIFFDLVLTIAGSMGANKNDLGALFLAGPVFIMCIPTLFALFNWRSQDKVAYFIAAGIVLLIGLPVCFLNGLVTMNLNLH